MNIRNLLITAGIAGVVMALLSNLPVLYFGNCLACMWLWASGILGAFLYHRFEGSASSLTAGQGAVIGVVSGLVGAIVGAIVSTLFGGFGLANLLGSQANNANELLGTSIGSLATAGSFSLIGLCFTAFIYPVFGAIGGAIGGVIFGKRATA